MSFNISQFILDLETAKSYQDIFIKYDNVNIKFPYLFVLEEKYPDIINIIVNNENFDKPLDVIRFIMNKLPFDNLCEQIITAISNIYYLAQVNKLNIIWYIGLLITQIFVDYEYSYVENLKKQLELIDSSNIECINYVQFIIDEISYQISING